MVTAEAYFAVGGHRGVGPYVLEDVALAHNIKRGKRSIRFRYAPDAVSARMYRSSAEMFEGWTKNLALLFNNALPLAAMRLLELILIVTIPLIAVLYPFPLSLPSGLALRGVDPGAMALLWSYGKIALPIRRHRPVCPRPAAADFTARPQSCCRQGEEISCLEGPHVFHHRSLAHDHLNKHD